MTIAHYILGITAFIAVIVGGSAFGYLAGVSMATLLAITLAWCGGLLCGVAIIARGQMDITEQIWAAAAWTVEQVGGLVQWSVNSNATTSQRQLQWLQRAVLLQGSDLSAAFREYYEQADVIHLFLKSAIADGKCTHCGSEHPDLLNPDQCFSLHAHRQISAWGGRKVDCPVAAGAANLQRAQRRKLAERN